MRFFMQAIEEFVGGGISVQPRTASRKYYMRFRGQDSVNLLKIPR